VLNPDKLPYQAMLRPLGYRNTTFEGFVSSNIMRLSLLLDILCGNPRADTSAEYLTIDKYTVVPDHR
jgi:hypothetical protein